MVNRCATTKVLVTVTIPGLRAHNYLHMSCYLSDARLNNHGPRQSPSATISGMSGSQIIDHIKNFDPAAALNAVITATPEQIKYVWARGNWTILMQAADYGYALVVEAILRRYKELDCLDDMINKTNRKMRGALSFAVDPSMDALQVDASTTDYPSVVRQLLEHGADPNLPDNSQETPMTRALKSEWDELINAMQTARGPMDTAGAAADGEGAPAPTTDASMSG